MAGDRQAGGFRLPRGGLVDRSRTLSFTFDGDPYRGYTGDTLASALAANGVRLVGRSFKYHRPRGILTAGSEEPNALVELRSGARCEPNTRATVVELYQGLAATSQNRWPSLQFDLLAVNSLLAPFFPAGFYYKTFMWPGALWEKLYEPSIRRAAGLGSASLKPDPDRYEKAWAHCDVLVIGAGPTGLMAALAAGRAGARVILADEDFRFGGRLLAEVVTIGGEGAAAWAERTVAELASLPNVRLMPRTTVFGVYDGLTYGAIERVNDHVATPPQYEPRQRGWRIIAKRAVLAAGATERPLTFPNNDRPGIMLAGAVRTYLNRFAVAPGKRAVVVTSSDDGWRTARDLARAAVEIVAVVDTRAGAKPREAAAFRVIAGGSVETAHGGQALTGLTVHDVVGSPIKLDCDLVVMSNGWNPTVHLTCHLGHKPQWREDIQAFVPATLPPGMAAGGAAAGTYALAGCLADGARLGAQAVEGAGLKPVAIPVPAAEREETGTVAPCWPRPGMAAGAFVDFQNDVTTKDVELAHREGYGAPEHVKRYTTLGMGTEQGKTANVTALAVIAALDGRTIPDAGTTTFRPPYTPISFGALAGSHRGHEFRPTRLPPSHEWAASNGAVFAETGLWLRAQYFRQNGDAGWQQSVAREAETVRRAAGICDVSTLGKIDVQGSDAAAFLDRVYANMISTLPLGRARYGIMLREDGFVLDDGTVSRLADQHFVLTTTTAHAEKVLQHLHFCHQVLWPTLDVAIVSVTEQWAQFAVAGPRARDVLIKLSDDPAGLSNAALPFMGVTEIRVGGVAGRVFRVSFSGELAYEVAVPTTYGDALFRALMDAGAEFGVTPYGTEALNVLRIEKGHASGPEIDGRTTARDLGMEKLVSAKKDCIGRVMSAREALITPERPMLVGFKAVDPEASLSAGAHLLAVGKPATAEHDEGHISSVARSPALKCDIGLGFLRYGRRRIGERVWSIDLLRGRDVLCEVVDPVFIDAKGERLRG
jgi:methylglutamate dehydrogenase subunit C